MNRTSLHAQEKPEASILFLEVNAEEIMTKMPTRFVVVRRTSAEPDVKHQIMPIDQDGAARVFLRASTILPAHM